MNRDFKGIWIPSEIWLNKDLTLIEKCFIVEVDSLDNSEGCFASNAYFSDFFSISKSRCSQIIKSLESKKLISIKYHYEGKQITKRVIRILKGGIKNIKGGYLENAEDNNTSINNTLLSIKKNTKKRTGEAVPVSDSAPLSTPKNKKEKVAQKRKNFDLDDVELPPVFLQHPELLQAFRDFFQMRKDIKKGYKTRKAVETKLRSLAKDCEVHGVEIVTGAILFSLESEYQGIFVHDYAKKQQQNEKQSNHYSRPKQTNIHEDFTRRLQERLRQRLSGLDNSDGSIF